MSIVTEWSDERGFTIQELMVTLVLGSLLVGFGFSLFLFISKMHGSWQRKIELQAAVNHAVNVITLDVLRSRIAPEISDTAVGLISMHDRRIRYHFNAGRIWRNADLLNPSENIRLVASVSRLRPVEREDHRSLFSIRITGSSKAITYSADVQVEMPRSSATGFRETRDGN